MLSRPFRHGRCSGIAVGGEPTARFWSIATTVRYEADTSASVSDDPVSRISDRIAVLTSLASGGGASSLRDVGHVPSAASQTQFAQ